MFTGAAGFDLGILDRHAAEHHHQFGVFGNAAPVGQRAADHAGGADDMGHDDHARGIGIVGNLACKAAKAVQEAVQQGARMVQPPGAGPAVGTGEDRGVAVGLAHPRQLVGDHVQRGIPIHRHEGLGAPARAVAVLALFQISLAHIGLVDPCFVIKRVGYGLDQGRGVGVAPKGPHAGNPAILQLRRKGAPMGGRRFKLLIRTLRHEMTLSDRLTGS